MKIYHFSFPPAAFLRLGCKYRPTCAGFSLVEVTLALGIVAFSLLTLVGLIPMGLTTFHKAINTSVSSQIVQQVVTDVQQTDFSQFTVQNPLRYFDDQGNQIGTVANPPSNGLAGMVYQVNVIVNAPTQVPGGSSSSNLASVIIEIVSNPGNQALTYDSGHSVKQDPSHGIFVSRYSAFVAKNQ